MLLETRVVFVQRTYAKGVHKHYGKTDRSRRRVPLSARAAGALAGIAQPEGARLVFPAARGGFIDLNNFRRREWAPACDAAGLGPQRVYVLRHSFAASALDAGLSTFEVARVMGTGVRMIERTYGHLVRDSDDRIRERLDARAAGRAMPSGR